MSIESKVTLKSYFETTDKPTQAQFASLIDTFVVGYIPIIGDQFPMPSFPACFLDSGLTGVNDLYTVPSGRKAYVTEMSYSNSTGGSITKFPLVYTNGAYQVIASTGGVAAGQYGQAQAPSPFILEAGEKLAVNYSAPGLTCWAKIIEFADTSLCKSIRLTSFINGNNTLYTAPALTTVDFILGNSLGGMESRVFQSQQTGSTRTYSLWMIPNGGAAANTNKFQNAITLNNASLRSNVIPYNMQPGDSIVMSSDLSTSSQMAWVNVVEHV